MQLTTSIQSALRHKISNHFTVTNNLKFSPVGGGSINETCRIEANDTSFFCKLNSASKFPQLFIKEKNGLELIQKQNVIKLPMVIDCFEYEDNQILLLQWIKQGERTKRFWEKFGEQLALLHQQTNGWFGLTEDNYMGSVPQSNSPNQNWPTFFQQERLQPMVERCFKKDLLTKAHLKQFESLYKELDGLFEDEKPSLLHGDLWSGNFMCSENNEPVLIDPAVYYGHRSVDLAMTILFGGFRQPFYDSYHYHFPFPFNYKEQWDVCNLYPLLLHLYLFGSSYLPQIQQTLNKLC